MKIQVIQLELHDDVISVRDQMGRGQPIRILLVWPASLPGVALPLQRRLDLLLLQRHAVAIGARLALICDEPEIRYHAAELGIPIFNNLRQAQAGSRDKPQRAVRRKQRKLKLRPLTSPEILLARRQETHARPRAGSAPNGASGSASPGWRFVILGIVLAALLALAAVLLPSAEITLVPAHETQQMEIPLSASTTQTSANLSGELPARWISIVVEGRETISTTGKVLLPEKPATGGVKFTNLTGQAIQVPAGTVVRGNASQPQSDTTTTLRFVTTQDGNLPPGSGRSLVIPIVALEPGSRGNLPAGSIQTIEGPLGLSMSASNPAALREGRDRMAPGPSLQDRALLYDRLFQTLQETARQELASRRSQNSSPSGPLETPGIDDYAILSSLKLRSTLEKRYTPESSAENPLPADQLELTLRLEFEALAVSSRDVQAIATPLLDVLLPEGYQAVPASLVVDDLTTPIFQPGSSAREDHATWRIRASREIVVGLPATSLAEQARALPVAKASQTLLERASQLGLVLDSPPQIRLFPSWWPYLPLISQRIQVKG